MSTLHDRKIYMKNILICATPAPGHVNPMLSVASHLKKLGHHIIFNTGSLFRDRIEALDIPFVSLTGSADYDYRQINTDFPDRQAIAPGIEQIIHDYKYGLGSAIPPQYDAIQQILAADPIDVILVDVMFWGILPLLLKPQQPRPPIVGFGVLPMLLMSQDVSPLPVATSSASNREQNQRENQQLIEMFSPVNEHVERVLASCGVTEKLPCSCWDLSYLITDHFFQLTAAAFEFPRSDLPDTIEFVGAVSPRQSTHDWEPDWWQDLDRSRPIVLVTQGTIANQDLSELIEPTLVGLADQDLTVIVSTGGASPDKIAVKIPANAKVVSFIPFDLALPEVDVFVTNGGYGSVQQSLSLGVPIVVAGATEDKPFVAVRVAWSGAGIDLATARPTPEQIGAAVQDILTEPTYQTQVQRLKHEFARYDALDLISSRIDILLDRA
jgi:MGT family glycosyltransferase